MRVVLPPQDAKGEITLRVLSFRLGAVNVAGNRCFDNANILRSLLRLLWFQPVDRPHGPACLPQGRESELRASQENFLGVTGYDAQGAVVPAESSSRSGDQHKVKFRAPVARIEMATASGLLKREYPFSVSRGVTAPAAGAAASAVAPEKPAAVAAAPAKPVPGKPAGVAQAPARPAPAKPAPAPALVAQAAPKAAAPAATDRSRAPRRPLASPPPEAPVVLPTKAPRYNDVMSAVMNRDRAGLVEALDAGMWADRADSNGATALMAAALNGDAAMVQLLLKHGADPSRRGPAGSVLEYANRSGNAQVVGLLKKAGAR